jgi:ATP-dependent Clp protease protease subunit
MNNECDCDVCNPSAQEDAPVELVEAVEQMFTRTRRILLTGEINSTKADFINSKLQLYSSSPLPVFIYINSEGGDLNAGYAILDQMQLCMFPIYTIVRGTAASMAASIAAYGTKGCRFITKNSTMFLHNMCVELPPAGVSAQNICVEHLIKYSEEKIADFASKLKIKRKKLEELLLQTCWLTPEQAIQIGLVDGIWSKELENNISVRNK